MGKSTGHPTDRTEQDDAALFREAVGEVKPLAAQNRIKLQNRPRRALLRTADSAQTIPDTLTDFGAENAPTEYLHNGLSRMDLRKLRRGTWPVQGILDLHGNSREAARNLLQEFLHEATQRKKRCVLVIHGKGINSPDGDAVLRKLSRHWLTQHPQVLAFCDAAAKQGGTGAALILLKVINGEK